ncbi:MAG: class I SAM-dependent methyltransferase [Proteobacteria bacterium]|nr:class I SAM-dependent methyltransferase [Pseudomonadota bacterium]
MRYAHARAEALGRRVHFSQQNAEATEFEDGSFDLVFSCLMLHETSGSAMARIFKECHRLLAPGGLMLHAEAPRYAGQDPYDANAHAWITYTINEPFLGAMHDTDLGNLSIASGFRPESVIEDAMPDPDAPSGNRGYSAGFALRSIGWTHPGETFKIIFKRKVGNRHQGHGLIGLAAKADAQFLANRALAPVRRRSDSAPALLRRLPGFWRNARPPTAGHPQQAEVAGLGPDVAGTGPTPRCSTATRVSAGRWRSNMSTRFPTRCGRVIAGRSFCSRSRRQRRSSLLDARGVAHGLDHRGAHQIGLRQEPFSDARTGPRAAPRDHGRATAHRGH